MVLERRVGFDKSVHAGSPAEARRALDDQVGGVDLVVVDLDLPGNLDLLEELRQAAPRVPVLGIIANGDRGPRARALEAWASEVLVLTASGEEIDAAARRLGG